MADASIVQGTVFDFFVVATNKFGDVVSVGDANVTLSDSTLGTVGVNGDGSQGEFVSTDGVGVEVLTPSAGGVVGTDYSVEITQDMTVANVSIQAAGPGPVTNVRIQRRGAQVKRR